MDSENVNQNLAVDPANEKKLRLKRYKDEMTVLAVSTVLDVEKKALYLATCASLSVHDVARVRIAAYKRIIGELQDCVSLDQCYLRTQRLANEPYNQLTTITPENVQNGTD